MKYLLIIAFITNANSSLPCELALIHASEMGMKFAISGKGYKKSIVADKNATKLCKGKLALNTP